MKKRVKAGTSKVAAAKRKLLFALAYLANGNNATKAAITAGLSKKTAYSTGQRMLKDAETQRIIKEQAEKAAQIAGLTVERTLKEVARLAYSDPRRLYDDQGKLIPIKDLDADTAATVASIEHEDEYGPSDGKGSPVVLTGRTSKIKVWDKNSALEKAMKHFGLYKADNEQLPQGIGGVQIFVQAVEPGNGTAKG